MNSPPGLWQVIENHEWDRVSDLLSSVADLNRPDDSGWTPLQRAIAGGCPLSIVDDLINGGADVNIARMSGETPLSLAQMRGQEDMISLLEARGAATINGDASDFSVSFPNGQVPLPVSSFESMGLSDQLIRGLFMYGFEFPTAVQSFLVPLMGTGRDIICQSQSGSGKTGAFTTGLLTRIRTTRSEVQAFISCPVSELVSQVANVVTRIGRYMGLRVATVRGYKADQRTPHVVCGTPGELTQWLQRHGGFERITVAVFDEIDQQLPKSAGREDEAERRGTKAAKLIDLLPPSCQLALVSATMPQETLTWCRECLTQRAQQLSAQSRGYAELLVRTGHETVTTIQQHTVTVEPEPGAKDVSLQARVDVLLDILGALFFAQGIVFVGSRADADEVAQELRRAGYPVLSAHADQDLRSRKQAFDTFREGRCRLLVTTDMWSRGVDVPSVACVINLDLPFGWQTDEGLSKYVHRIGRAGRHGRNGLAISIVDQKTDEKFRQLVSKKFGCSISNSTINQLSAEMDKMVFFQF